MLKMNVALDFKISLRYAAYYGAFFILEQCLLLFLYEPGGRSWLELSSWIGLPIQLVVFPTLLVLAHSRYRKVEKLHTTFNDVLLISLLIIFFAYLIDFCTKTLFFTFYFEALVVVAEHGISFLDMLANLDQPSAPTFAPLSQLIVQPFSSLFYAIEHVSIDFLIGALFGNAILYIFVILYFENLFLLFKKYGENPWYALVPFLNKWILLRITGEPKVGMVFFYIPFIRYIFLYVVHVKIARDFGKGKGWAIGMTLLPSIFYGELSFNPAYIPVRHATLEAEE